MKKHLRINIPRGFTFMEVMVVVAVIGILAMMAVPAIMSLAPYQRARGEAQHAAVIMQQARLKAANTQKPMRVVVNCAKHVATGEPCVLLLQSAIYDLGQVSGWTDIAGTRHEVHPKVDVLPIEDPGAPGAHDGDAKLADVYWTIFMPSSRVFSDPRPSNLFFGATEFKTNTPWRGWILSVNSASGRTTLNGGPKP